MRRCLLIYCFSLLVGFGAESPGPLPNPMQPVQPKGASALPATTPSADSPTAGAGTASSALQQASPPIIVGVPNPDRKIQPGDLLVITIVGESGLQTEFRVSANGEIQFPFLDLVQVAGLTPLEAKRRLEELLKKDYFVDPQVILTVKEYRPKYVRIFGAVARQGLIPLPGDQQFDILDAIAYVGGTTRYAKDKVKYTHNGVTVEFSLRELMKLTDPAQKVWVQDGDIIEVEERIF